MCDFTKATAKTISEHARATEAPSFTDRPFGCPLDTVLDLPVPPSVNKSRKVDWAAQKQLNAWKDRADAALWASGQFKTAQKNINRFELHILLDEKKCRLDQDNGLKNLVDYLRRLGIIVNDSKKHWRRTVIEWGSAPEGVRVTVKPLEEYDARRDFAGSLEEGYRAIRERQAAGGPGWEPKAAPVDPWIPLGDAAANVVGKLKRGE